MHGRYALFVHRETNSALIYVVLHFPVLQRQIFKAADCETLLVLLTAFLQIRNHCIIYVHVKVTRPYTQMLYS